MSEKKVAVVNNREEVINEVLLFDVKVYLRKNPLIWILFMYKYFYSCLLHAHMFPCLLIRGQCLSLWSIENIAPVSPMEWLDRLGKEWVVQAGAELRHDSQPLVWTSLPHDTRFIINEMMQNVPGT